MSGTQVVRKQGRPALCCLVEEMPSTLSPEACKQVKCQAKTPTKLKPSQTELSKKPFKHFLGLLTQRITSQQFKHGFPSVSYQAKANRFQNSETALLFLDFSLGYRGYHPGETAERSLHKRAWARRAWSCPARAQPPGSHRSAPG